jgi:magnesium chelatase family protein
LLDRIDLHIDVARVPFDEIVSRTAGESSATIRARVERARTLQRERYVGCSRQTNASIGARDVRRHCALNPDAISLLRNAAAHGNLSARGLDRLARVAGTIADLEGAPTIEVRHIAEAIGYRTLERKGLAA